MPKRITKVDKQPSKYVNNASDFLATKAADRKRIPAIGKDKEVEWRRWWTYDESKIGLATETIILKIENEQSLRFTSFINWARLYGNWEAMSWGANVLNNTNQDLNNESPLRLNLIQSGIDACAAKIAKDFPQPYFLTNGGEYFDKLKAEKLTKYVKGVIQEANVLDKSIMQFRDAGVYGTGALHFYYFEGKIRCDWVPTFELRVADYDGMTHQPQSMHRVRMISREKLIAMFPDKEDIIEKISTNPVNRIRDNQSVVDMVRLKESWHLQSSKKKKDGVYAVTINDTCLLRKEYTLPIFPIVCFDWMTRPLGFYGRSITEEVYSIQMSVDETLNVASQSYSMVGMPIIFVPDGAQVPEDVLLQNFIGRMVPYRGNTPPQFATPDPLPASFFNWLSQQIQWVFQIIGLSQASATSENQLGPNASGEAIRQMVDIETTRFSQVSKRWENNFVKIAEVIVALSELHPDTTAEFTYRKRVTKFNFTDVKLPSFTIKCDPVSQLPDTVAGRIQTIQDWIDRNWISKERGMELLQLDPDLEQEVNIQISSLRVCEMRLCQMVEEGTPFMPEPFMNLTQALQVSLGVYNMLVADQCPEDRLELVRQWIQGIVSLQQSPNPYQLNAPTSPQGPQAPAAGAPNPQLPATPMTPQLPPGQ